MEKILSAGKIPRPGSTAKTAKSNKDKKIKDTFLKTSSYWLQLMIVSITNIHWTKITKNSSIGM